MPSIGPHIHSCKHLFDHFKIRKRSLQFALVTLGSIITDLENLNVLKNVHWRAEAFFQYLRKTDPKYAPLALGMIMHEEMDKAIDKHFVHPNIPKAARLLKKFHEHNDKDDPHYFLDHFFNIEFMQREPDLIAVAEHAKRRLTDKHIHKIAYHMTKFFGGDKQLVFDTIHLFKDFDLTQYLRPDEAAGIYGKFMLLKENLTGKKPSILSKAKLALAYFTFMFGNRKHILKEMFARAINKFSNNRKAYTIALKAMRRKYNKLTIRYHAVLK